MMATVTESSGLDDNQNLTESTNLQINNDMVDSTVTAIPSVLKRTINNSVISNKQEYSQRFRIGEQNYPSTLLKNKALLVPTRLALKRQRASFKPLSMNCEPVYSNNLQLELGNPDEFGSHYDVVDDDEQTTTISQNIYSTSEQIRRQSTSNHTSPLREGTPHTVPTDISLLYREKPLFSHPVTGHFIVQYAEENGFPSPCSYVLPRKSYREKNAPAFTFGSRCFVEKNGGSRTAWQKQWFAHSDPYTTKVDFKRELIWPTPFHYRAKPAIGIQATKVSFPAWSIASRLHTNPTIKTENNPSPDTYDTITAFRKLKAKNTYITLKSRPGGTQISTLRNTDLIPGPGAHDETKFSSNKSSAPKHSFGKRLPTSYSQDPYVNTLPPVQT